MRRHPAMAIGLVITSAAAAQAGGSGHVCAPADDLRREAMVRPMTVAPGAGKLHFVQGEDGGADCPGPAPACASRAYLVPGDQVAVTRIAGDYACAAFQGGPPHFAQTTGWLPRSGLAAPAGAAHQPADWAGAWTGGAARVVIRTAAGGRIALAGTAHAEGAMAEFAVEVTPAGNAAGFATDASGALVTGPAAPGTALGCAIHLWRVGGMLAVADNGRCGDSRARFSGFYRPEAAGVAAK